MNKRGQVTLFVILALIIVVAGVLIWKVIPSIKSESGLDVNNPQGYIQTCVEDSLEEAVEILAPQGGSIEPEHYYMYFGDNIEYLCYSNNYYQTCTVQQPLLKNHIESEIEEYISDVVDECFNSLKESYQNKNYVTSLKPGEMKVELLPKRIAATFNYSLAISKGEDSQDYEQFNVFVNNNIYELISIANSIVDWESTYGDAETTIYMTYYPDLKVEKKKQSDGTTIYIITDRNTEDLFQFASRSMAWPPGY